MPVNRISITITDAQKTSVKDAVTEVANLTQNWHVPISKEELKPLPKIADGSIPFVEKVAQYAVSNPEFLPPFGDVPEFKKDFKGFMDLREIVRPLRQVVDNLENSMMVCGSEAWEFARAYYKSVQYHAKMGVPGAQAIYDDLRQRFEKSQSKPAPEEPKP
jgi:hypothetical protein